MLKHDEWTDKRTGVWKAFQNLPTTAFGCWLEIIIPRNNYCLESCHGTNIILAQNGTGDIYCYIITIGKTHPLPRTK